MTAADEMRADIEQAKDEIKGIIKRFTEKHGYVEIDIIAFQTIKEMLNERKICNLEVKMNVKL